MLQQFKPGDVLVFQIESGYSLLSVLAVDTQDGNTVWHVAAYNELFLDVESAEHAVAVGSLSISSPHIALTSRAFESTQVAKIASIKLTTDELAPLESWRQDPNAEVSDRSVRLMLGLR